MRLVCQTNWAGGLGGRASGLGGRAGGLGGRASELGGRAGGLGASRLAGWKSRRVGWASWRDGWANRWAGWASRRAGWEIQRANRRANKRRPTGGRPIERTGGRSGGRTDDEACKQAIQVARTIEVRRAIEIKPSEYKSRRSLGPLGCLHPLRRFAKYQTVLAAGQLAIQRAGRAFPTASTNSGQDGARRAHCSLRDSLLGRQRNDGSPTRTYVHSSSCPLPAARSFSLRLAHSFVGRFTRCLARGSTIHPPSAHHLPHRFARTSVQLRFQCKFPFRCYAGSPCSLAVATFRQPDSAPASARPCARPPIARTGERAGGWATVCQTMRPSGGPGERASGRPGERTCERPGERAVRL